MSGTEKPFRSHGTSKQKNLLYAVILNSSCALHIYLETFYKMLLVEISSSDQLNSNSWCRGPDINFKSLPGYYNVH